MTFQDRSEAGRLLAAHLAEHRTALPDLVLALPRGGVPVAFEIASLLKLPLDVFLVRKLGVPGQEELAMGAIASGGVRVLNPEVISALHISPFQIDSSVAHEARELRRREAQYRGQRAPLSAKGRSPVLVDDGIATGASMRAAIMALRQQDPKRIIVATPVAARNTCAELEREADLVVCLYKPFQFDAVGQWYREFDQTDDEQVRGLLDRAWHNPA